MSKVKKARDAIAPTKKLSAQKYAEMATAAPLTAAIVAVNFSRNLLGDRSKDGAADVMVMADEMIGDTAREASAGRLGQLEGMLAAQAVALNAVFTELSCFAAQSQHLDKFERYLRLALKAQGQCRATIETLAAIKNPPIVMAKQANITSGPQQVNNGLAVACADESRAVQNELLEARHVEWVDPRAASQAEDGDPELATVGRVHGAANARR